MKALYLLLVSLLVIAGCDHQQIAKPIALETKRPLIIDHPSGVLIIPYDQDSALTINNLNKVKQILFRYPIQIISSDSELFIFIKNNGDRVTLKRSALENMYDLILFNGTDDPLPVKFIDLQKASDLIFNTKPDGNKPIIKHNDSQNIPIYNNDIQPTPLLKKWIALLTHRSKIIIIPIADTSTRNLITRNIPDIQWVEHRIDTRTLLKIGFENDLLTYSNTDRYFTNGISFELQSPRLSYGPIDKLMIPYHHKAFVSYKLNLVQNMYTPTDTRVPPKLKNDRPYASYLFLGYRKTYADPRRKLKFYSQLDIGYIGPQSPGSYMQTIVHKIFPTNDKPLGWETQLNTDIILNYNYQIQKALIYKKNINLLAGLDATAGTLHTQVGANLQFQLGESEPLFGLTEGKPWPSIEYYFFTRTQLNIVGYNMLLQGGMLTHPKTFTLKASEIQRIVGSAEAGFHFSYKGVGLEIAQHFLSPEYKEGLWHKWGRIGLLIKL